MALLDQYGRPVAVKALKERIADAGVTGVRSAWAQGVASGLTPAGLTALLARAAEGDLHDYLVLAEEMEERDPHYASVLGTRKRAVSGVQPSVIAASDAAQDQKIAAAVRDHIAQHDAFPHLVEDIMDALGKGFSCTEIIWRAGQTWTIEAFEHRDPRHFIFDRETGRELRLIDLADPVHGVPLQPFKWITYRAKLKSGLTARGGLARLVAFGWMCKSYALKDWIAFVETFGLPMRLGRYDAMATKDDVQVLYRAVANIGTDAAAVLPRNMDIEFQEVSGGQGNNIFEHCARWVDEQTSKAVLGQTMTSDNGSSQAQAKVHDSVRHDIAAADARAVSATLNRDLVRPFVDLNFGVQARYPRLKIEVAEPEDTNMILTNAARLVALGLPIKQTELRGKLGFSDPDGDDAVIGGAAKPAQTIAANRPQDLDPYAPIDEIEAEMNDEWQAVTAPLLEPLIGQIQAAGSYAAALAVVRNGFAHMRSGPLIDQLVKAAAKSYAHGDADGR